jgi:hypothetical protein
MKAIDLTGQRFSMLTAIGLSPMPGKRQWLCRCDCGGEKVATTSNLRAGDVTNCGCRTKGGHLKHGHNRTGQRTKEYRTWCHIRQRCENPQDEGYCNYGARGIAVAPEWQVFDCFLADMGMAPSRRHSIERINNDLGYTPANCKWATPLEQARNTRRVVRTPDGKCLSQTCEERGLNYDAVQARLRRGTPMELALSPLAGHAYRAMLAASPSIQGDPE